MHPDTRVARVAEFFEQLTPASLASLPAIYTEDARFKDPFNQVQGHAAIGAIFEHMFRNLQGPRFQVLSAVAQGDEAFLTWDFHFAVARGGAMCIHGASHLRFAPDGRVAVHRDYWDAAEELYEKLPLIGALMRWLRRRVNA